MAYKITDFDGTTIPAGGDYPAGDVKNSPSGTIVNRKSLDDMWQFFQWIMFRAGITPNSLPDNLANGYQLYDAYCIAMYQAIQTPVYSGTFIDDGSSPIRYRIDGNTVRLKGVSDNSGPTVVTSNTPVFTLPVGYRPPETQLFYTVDADTVAPAVIQINTSGVVSLRGDLFHVSTKGVWFNLCFDLDA